METSENNTLRYFISQITGPTGLNIDKDKTQEIITILEKKINLDQIIDRTIIEKVNSLINADKNIQDFEEKINNSETKTLFNQLKLSLAKLQTLSLIKKLKKSEDCSDVLNLLLKALNQKIESVNNILLDQNGGGNNDNKFINKYYKYKVKYLNLKYNFLI